MVIELFDDDDKLPITPTHPTAKKRQHNESDDARLSQCPCVHSPNTPGCPSPTTLPVRSSTSPPLSFPSSPSSPIQQKVLVPTGKWPAGMYTCDMKLGFEQVGSKALKTAYPLLSARLAFVFGREIPANTWGDQVRLWTKEASGHQHDEYAAKGRVPDGLWAAFRKAVRS